MPKLVCSPSSEDYRPKTNVHGRNREREGNLKLECGWCAHYRGANVVILNWQESLSEGDQEVVKRSGRDELMWVSIHKCMEAMLGICLYSYLYLKLAKMLCLFLLSPMFSLQQNLRTRGWYRFCPEAGWGGRWGKRIGEVAQTMYTPVNKCF
jgi:hypothetical protein